MEPVSNPDMEQPSPPNYNFDPDTDSDLDHYLVGPDGVYLNEVSELDTGMSDSDDDLVLGLDPEPSPGPVDPG